MSILENIFGNGHKKHSIKYDRKSDCVHVVVKGEVDLSDIRKYASETASALSKHKSRYLLADYREAKLRMSIPDLYEVPRILEEEGIERSIKGAVIVSDEFDKFNFFETASNNYGQLFKITTDIDEAFDWLNINSKN